MTPDNVGDAKEAIATAKLIYPFLAGRPPHIQGAILVDLVSTFIVGHISRAGDAAETATARETALNLLVDTVRKLVAKANAASEA
jgi:hypothetical protein